MGKLYRKLLRSLQIKLYRLPSPFRAERQDPPTLSPLPPNNMHTHILLFLCIHLFLSLLLVSAPSKWTERQFPRERTHPSCPIHLSQSQPLRVGGVQPGFVLRGPSCWLVGHLPVAPVSLHFFLYRQAKALTLFF